MRSGLCVVVVALALSWAGASIAAQSAGSAYKQAQALESQGKYNEIIKILLPYADEKNKDVDFALANAYLMLAINGKQVEEVAAADIKPAIEFAQRGAADGSAGSLNLLYEIYGNGWGGPADAAKATDFLMQAVLAGDLGAKFNYAVMLYQGSWLIKRNVDKACPLFEELSREKSTQVIASYYEGMITFAGQCGKAANKVAGVGLIKIAADHEVRQAERDMGRSFEFGWIGPVDLNAAFEWYQKAAALGEPRAQWRIGMAYINGELGPKDSAKGVHYLEEASASGDAPAMTDLAVMYVTGDGVRKDFAKARSLYEKATEQEEPHAFKELAAMYANGEGVPVDPVRARVLYLQSIEFGEKDDSAFRKALDSRLDAAQMKESDRQYEQWRQKRASR